MIPVSFDEVFQVTLVPFVEISRIIVSGLLLPPHVESLVLDDETHLVT